MDNGQMDNEKLNGQIQKNPTNLTKTQHIQNNQKLKTGKLKAIESSFPNMENPAEMYLFRKLKPLLEKAEVIKLEKQEDSKEQIQLTFIQYRGMKLLDKFLQELINKR